MNQRKMGYTGVHICRIHTVMCILNTGMSAKRCPISSLAASKWGMWRANFSRPQQTLVASINYRTIHFLWHRILPLHMRACECRLSDFPDHRKTVSQCDKMWQTQSHKHHQHGVEQFFFGNVTIETISCQTLNMLAPTRTLLHTYNRHDQDHDHDHEMMMMIIIIIISSYHDHHHIKIRRPFWTICWLG